MNSDADILWEMHGESFYYTLNERPDLYENDQDYLQLKSILDRNKTPTPNVGNSYAYTSIMASPFVQILNIAHTKIPHKLIDIANGKFIFEVNGNTKQWPDSSPGSLHYVMTFDSTKDFDQFREFLTLSLTNWKISYKVLDDQILEELDRIKSLAGVWQDKY